MTANCIGITEEKDGIDFFFAHRSHALNFVSFLHGVVPLECKTSKRLVSHDPKSNLHNFKYVFYGELPTVCRNDLVAIPPSLSNKLGGRSPLLLCHKVTNCLHFVDPTTLHTVELDQKQFFKSQFSPICNTRQATVFFVMSVRHLKKRKGKFQLSELDLVRDMDVGAENPELLETVTHLGGIIKEGDFVKGYDMANVTSAMDILMNKRFLVSSFIFLE